MTTFFVSRHQGAIDWALQQNLAIDTFVAHLDIDQVNAGDIVIGTLPIHLAAEVCAKGANFFFLTINISFMQRGVELSTQQLTAQNCKIQPFFVKAL